MSRFFVDSSTLLIDELPMQVLPTLALEMGLNECIVLQRFHDWSNPSYNHNLYKGCRWIKISYKELHEEFPFWSLSTLINIIRSLERQNLLVSLRVKSPLPGNYKQYSVNYGALGFKSLPYSVQRRAASCQ